MVTEDVAALLFDLGLGRVSDVGAVQVAGPPIMARNLVSS